MKPVYHTIEEMIGMIEEPNRSIVLRIFSDNEKLFKSVKGSTTIHHAWPGGYYDHIREVMNISLILHRSLNLSRPLSFSVSDALLVLFLHDIEKPWKYEINSSGEIKNNEILKTKEERKEFRDKKLAEYGINLTPEQENGLKYVEGENKDYTNTKRVMGPLAAFCHLCDIASARMWFNCPSKSNDPWTGASRISD